MRCPYCDSDSHRVKDTQHDKNYIYRLRQCSECNKRFGTIESYNNLIYVRDMINMIRNLSKKGE